MPAKIRRVTLFAVLVRAPKSLVHCHEFYHEPINRSASGKWDGEYFADMPFYIIRVDGDGLTGWGDTGRKLGGDAKPAVLLAGAAGDKKNQKEFVPPAMEAAARSLLGKGPKDFSAHESPGPDWPTRGLHTAVLDWKARCEGVPLYKLFGPRVREGIEVANWRGFRTPQGAAQVALETQQRGFNCIKLKAGENTDAIGIARHIKAACGEGFHVVIDPNRRWDHQTVFGFARGIVAESSAVSLEDPITDKNGGTEVMAKVRRETGIPIYITVNNIPMLQRVVAADAVDGFNLGGHWPTLIPLSKAAHEAGLPYWHGSSCESGLGDIATVHFGVTQEAFSLPCEIAGHMVREHPLIDRLFPYKGHLAVPAEEPGLGMNGDMDGIERHRIADPIVFE